MLTSPKVNKDLLLMNKKNQKERYEKDESLFVQSHPDKQISPWNNEEHQQNLYQSYAQKLLSPRSMSLNKKSRLLGFSSQIKSKQFALRRANYIRKASDKERSLKTNLISLSLDKNKNDDLFDIRPRKIVQSSKEQPNRVKELKKKLEAKEKSIKAQKIQVYNKTIQMFSTCLTQRFTKDLLEDTLLIYPAMPKRQPKVDIIKRKAHQSHVSPKALLPNLPIGTDRPTQMQNSGVLSFANTPESWRLKGEDIKNKIRYLMLREKVGESRGDYSEEQKEYKQGYYTLE